MRVFTYLIVFILIVIGFTFACLNAEPVLINYYIGQHEFPLSFLLVLALGLGGLLGLVAGLLLVIRLKQANYSLQHKNKVLTKEVETLREQLPLLEDNA